MCCNLSGGSSPLYPGGQRISGCDSSDLRTVYQFTLGHLQWAQVQWRTLLGLAKGRGGNSPPEQGEMNTDAIQEIHSYNAGMLFFFLQTQLYKCRECRYHWAINSPSPDNLCNGKFHKHLQDLYAPLVVRYVDLMESSIAQSIHRGFERESWEPVK